MDFVHVAAGAFPMGTDAGAPCERPRHEVWLDTQILAGLADKSPNIDGMKLSRFDRVLGLNRERIERIYRGERGTRLRLAG